MVTEKEAEAAIMAGLCLYRVSTCGHVYRVNPVSITGDHRGVTDRSYADPFRLSELYLTQASAELKQVRMRRDEIIEKLNKHIDAENEVLKKACISEIKMRARLGL
jgi:hypothetical protein